MFGISLLRIKSRTNLVHNFPFSIVEHFSLMKYRDQNCFFYYIEQTNFNRRFNEHLNGIHKIYNIRTTFKFNNLPYSLVR
ncbi:hypothetical protein BpHYR1_015536 [Brachionus plicatilis]|uniref:Uncharacterized protein n=1 Tax=Brachionus plicatilis TaxID=10195 RepID=A0A3M7PIP3_BRAPC|nr:hypothetical protein BpHYR1_015536 [Brachionus plicatilis]